MVFKLDTAGQETVLYAFTDAADGGFPYAGVIRDPAGKRYGTTNECGAAGAGVVYMREIRTSRRRGRRRCCTPFRRYSNRAVERAGAESLSDSPLVEPEVQLSRPRLHCTGA